MITTQLLRKRPSHRFAEQIIPCHSVQDSRKHINRMQINTMHPSFDDELVDALQQGLSGESYYGREDGSNLPYCTKIPGSLPQNTLYLRSDVVRRLKEADKQLIDAGIRLYLLDGWRSRETQWGLWNFFEARIKKQFPKLSNDAIQNQVKTFVSPPLEEGEMGRVSPHLSGGAIDLTLQDIETGQFLDMGSLFDEPAETSFTSYFENHKEENPVACENRRVLYWAMLEAGFTNYPAEWWHYDFGNQNHAWWSKFQRGINLTAAVYGEACCPEISG